LQDIGLFAVTESQCTEDEHDDEDDDEHEEESPISEFRLRGPTHKGHKGQ